MNFKIDKSKDGYDIVRLEIDGKKQYIGSKYNQKREIDNFIKSFKNFTVNDNYIVFGLSLGEHILELLNVTSDNSMILVIEINEKLIEYCKDNDCIRNIILNPRIVLASDINGVKNFFRNHITQMNVNNLEIGYYARYDKIYKDKLLDIYDIIRSESERIISDKNTSLYFGNSWFDSLLNNLKYMAKGSIVNELKDRYKNIPAIIVSAGPSLQKNIDELKGFNNALLLSGGRTLSTLVEKGINPDCICVVDPGDVSYKLVEKYIDKIKAPLVFYEGTNSDVVKHHNGKKIFSANNKFLSEIWGENIQSLSGGGSVSHAMTILAAYMGCNPIVFIGQDFAYTGERGHAACAENKWQKLTFDNYKRSDDLYIEDINGEIVRTSIVLNSYRLAMEEIIKVFPNTKFINATEGGANIKGAENKKLKDVIASLEEREIYDLEYYLKNNDKTQEIINGLENSVKVLKECIFLCDKAKRSLEKFKFNFHMKKQDFVNRELNILNDIDNKLRKNLNDIHIINSILFSSVYEIENNKEFIIDMSDDKEVRFNKNFNKNKAIYSAIKQTAEICCEKLELAIKELEG